MMEVYNSRLTKNQAEAYHKWIADLYEEKLKTGGDLSSCDNEIWKRVNAISDTGMLIYQSYSDKELLDILRAAAIRVGRVPTKSDVYCVLRSYIKVRFGCWNEALVAAGILKKTEPITDDNDFSEQEIETLLNRIPEKEQKMLFGILMAYELPAYYPAKQIAKKNKKAAISILKDEYEYERLINLLKYRDEITQANVKASVSNKQQLEHIKKTAISLGRTPLRFELDEQKAFQLWKELKGWGRVLQACSLKPLKGDMLKRAREEYAVRRASPIKVSHDLSQEKIKLLEELCIISRGLGRTIGKEDIPKELLLLVNRQFGSWKAVLMKMGILLMDGDDVNDKTCNSK